LLWRIFGPKREKVIKHRRKLLIKSLIIVILRQILFDDEIKKGEMDGPCSTHGEKRSVYTISVGKPEVKRPLGRPKRRHMGG
jgi:hypothetical protein